MNYVPMKPFPDFKWQWACVQCTEGLNDPVLLLGVLFRMRKLERLDRGIKYSSDEFAKELIDLSNDTKDSVGVDLARRTGSRNLIRNSGQYWRAVGLIPPADRSGRIQLTEFGKKVADHDISQTEFAAITVQTFRLPNPNVQEQAECKKWLDNGLVIYPLRLSIAARTIPSKNYEISIDPIIMPDYYTRIVNCQSLSKLQFKVAKPGLKLLKEHKIINGYDVLTGDIDAGTDFYVDIIISGGKRGGRVPVTNLQEFLQRIVNAIREAREKDSKTADGSKPTFSKANLRGFDADAGKTIPYDLLDEKLVQTELVEKISNRSKYVNSRKMFAALAKAYRDKKDIALMYMEQMQ